jgi:hypothetical protein
MSVYSKSWVQFVDELTLMVVGHDVHNMLMVKEISLSLKIGEYTFPR